MAKTKIVSTLGPACADAATMLSLIEGGTDCFRINFSHGSRSSHSAYVTQCNEARRQTQRVVALMGDLCGPKIRTGSIEPEGQALVEGDLVTIEPGTEATLATHFSTNYADLSRDLAAGQRVFIDDGRILLKVIEQQGERNVCRVLQGGVLHSNKGINLPDTVVSAPSITKEDWRCVEWAVAQELDFLALSFVRSAADIRELREFLCGAGANIRIVAKFETPQAIEQMEEIIMASDVSLVARGDLGVEMDSAQVPLLQKRITRLCRAHGKPVLVATHMLQSMIHSPTATRAEVSDIANAIMDYTDAVLLSGETAIGEHALRALQTIGAVSTVTEAHLDRFDGVHPQGVPGPEHLLSATLASCVAQIVDRIEIVLVVVWSEDGWPAQFLGKTRVDVPILALSSDFRTCRHMCLNYGVIPHLAEIPADVEAFAQLAERLAVEQGLARSGDQICLVLAPPLGYRGSGQGMIVHTLS